VIRIDNTEEVTKKTEQLSSLNSASPKKLSVNNMATANQNDNDEAYFLDFLDNYIFIYRSPLKLSN
jgi:hypothetical protein